MDGVALTPRRYPSEATTLPNIRLVAQRLSQTEPACAIAMAAILSLEPLKDAAQDVGEATLIEAMQLGLTRAIGDLRERERLLEKTRKERR